MTRYLVFGVGLVLGVILGFYLSRPAMVRAQAENVVHITEIRTKRAGSQSVPGEVIGFSCTAPNNGGVGTSECYALSR
jgi:hypothetical protein